MFDLKKLKSYKFHFYTLVVLPIFLIVLLVKTIRTYVRIKLFQMGTGASEPAGLRLGNEAEAKPKPETGQTSTAGQIAEPELHRTPEPAKMESYPAEHFTPPVVSQKVSS